MVCILLSNVINLRFLFSAADINHLSPWPHHIDHSNTGNHVSSLLTDSRSVPWNSRNSSLTHTSNCSNSNDQNALASTNNSESFLIASSSDGNSSSSKPPPLSPPKNLSSSSPAATHRFPYLHCIPCLNEKPESSKHLADNKVPENSVVVGNGTVTTNASTSDAASNRTCEKGQSPTSLERSSVSTGHQCSIQNSDTHELSPNRQANISGILMRVIKYLF